MHERRRLLSGRGYHLLQTAAARCSAISSSGRPLGLSTSCAYGADADATAGDPNYLVLAMPNVMINDIRLQGLGLGVAESNAAGRKAPITTHRPPETLDDPSGTRPLVPG